MTTSEPKFLRTLFFVGLIFCGLIVCVWLGISKTAAEKVATALAQPLGVLWYLLICLTVMSLKAKQKRITLAVVATTVAFTAFNNGFLCQWLTRSLENDYVNCHPLSEDPFDVIVLLGGGGTVGSNGRLQGNQSGDRLILAAELYHAGLTPQIVCTGTRIKELSAVDVDPADASAGVLQRLGVPATAVTKGRGRTTSEEMQNLKQDFSQSHQRIGLVTSAWHLPRAMKLAKRNGLNAVPLPADFLSGQATSKTLTEVILTCIPQADTAFVTARIIKEYMGMAVGR